MLSFLPVCPRTSELFTPSFIYPPDYKHTYTYNLSYHLFHSHTLSAQQNRIDLKGMDNNKYINCMKKESRRTWSLQALSRHQERINGMVHKISQYRPTFHINKNYRAYDVAQRAKDIQKRNDRLFEENMQLIHRLETAGPRIETKKFPQIKHNPGRLKSLSITRSRSSSIAKTKTKDAFRNGQQLFEENLRLITNIECTGPKIQCWTTRKVRNLNELIRAKKREEEKQIIQKFKDISKQLSKIGKMNCLNRSTSITSLRSGHKPN